MIGSSNPSVGLQQFNVKEYTSYSSQALHFEEVMRIELRLKETQTLLSKLKIVTTKSMNFRYRYIYKYNSLISTGE